MLKDSNLLKAYRGEAVSRTPLWLMRQAGRYLPEYRKLRETHSMLKLLKTPELAAQVTLQPIQRFGFDAAIIFADILTPICGMGIELDFIEGRGPVIANPLKGRPEIEDLKIVEPEQNVPYTLEAIKQVCSELRPKGVPLIGFCGAPFTLSLYLSGLKGEEGLALLRAWMRHEAEAWELLQTKLVAVMGSYLVAQVKAGASALQIFDSWAGSLRLEEFQRFELPYLKQLCSFVRSRTDVPLVYFSLNSSHLFSAIKDCGAAVFGVDWRVSLKEAAQHLGSVPLQGNLNPELLLGPWEVAQPEVQRILGEGRSLPGFVFNLGHGILPKTPLENVQKLVESVRGL